MSAMTKKEWMEYLEKTWDAAQKEAWSEPQFECPRCGHCCQIQQAAQQAVEVMDAHMMRADTDGFYEAKEALRQALETEQKTAVSPGKGTGFNYFRALGITSLRQALETEQEPVAWISEGGDVSRSKRYMDEMGFKCNPLYTAPPKREWVGLTLNEAEDFYDKYTDRAELINAVDKFLEEKNA